MLTLTTRDLVLIAADGRLARAAVLDALEQPPPKGEFEFRDLLKAEVGPYWPPEVLADVQDYFADVLEADATLTGWWVWYILHQENDNPHTRELIGAAGFAGKADGLGQVQIGYAIVEPYQKRGYATQAAGALIDWALADQAVDQVVAETFPDMTASLRVLEKVGMQSIGQGKEPGTVKYARSRNLVVA